MSRRPTPRRRCARRSRPASRRGRGAAAPWPDRAASRRRATPDDAERPGRAVLGDEDGGRRVARAARATRPPARAAGAEVGGRELRVQLVDLAPAAPRAVPVVVARPANRDLDRRPPGARSPGRSVLFAVGELRAGSARASRRRPAPRSRSRCAWSSACAEQALGVGDLRRADDRLQHRDLPRRHRQVAQAEARSASTRASDRPPCRRTSRPACPRVSAPTTICLSGAQDRRVQRVVEVPDVLVLAVGGQRVLDEIVGADAEEVALGRQQIGDERRARRLDHDAERHLGIVGDALASRARRRPRRRAASAARSSATPEMSGKQDLHAARRPPRGRARAAACGRGRRGGASSGSSAAPSPGWSPLGMRTDGRQLVAAEVERAEGDRPPPHALERRDGVRVLLVLRGAASGRSR